MNQKIDLIVPTSFFRHGIPLPAPMMFLLAGVGVLGSFSTPEFLAETGACTLEASIFADRMTEYRTHSADSARIFCATLYSSLATILLSMCAVASRFNYSLKPKKFGRLKQRFLGTTICCLLMIGAAYVFVVMELFDANGHAINRAGAFFYPFLSFMTALLSVFIGAVFAQVVLAPFVLAKEFEFGAIKHRDD